VSTVTIPRLLAAVTIGVTYHLVSIVIWGFLAAGNDPLQNYFLDTLMREERHVVAYRILISLHDVALNLLLALPFAAAFRLIPALRSWTCVALAAAVAVVGIYWNMVWEQLPFLARNWQFWFGLLMTALSLPAAFSALNRRVTPRAAHGRDA
jgi:hypothetical protein